ncbi:hypothetical protein [Empedobacter tilapiae]|uniref:DUF3828 domain-containing protein n=1 Tax=Empedobacter tilapiae TaxID=2491114 RepID=A0A4Z1BLH7_9FLAO|nr:hypothetical protein [Empedobacter tilapiae]TGN22985.1 hypothetical protein E4J94_15735 [Empedobacter tilapiae]
MKKFILSILLLSFVTSCNSHNSSTENKVENKVKDSVKESDVNYNVALDFMNNYVDYIMDTIGKVNEDEYINKNELLTQSFKDRYKFVQDSAYKVEPEVGLDFDPIVDGQDFPDKGFKIKSIDKATGLVTLKGIDWQDFEVVLKVVNENNKSLVNGSGIINIPTNKQAKR